MVIYKKCLWVFIIALIVFAASYVNCFASSDTVMTIGTVNGQKGDTVEVCVSINQADGIASGGFTITYNTSVLTIEDAYAGELLDNTQCSINTGFSSNSVRVTFAGANAFTSGGQLVTLKFKIKTNAAFGESVLSASNVKFMDVNAETVTRESINGSVNVVGASASLSSANLVAGESTALDFNINEPLASCGCQATLTFDASSLSVGKIVGVDKLGTTPISFSSSVDNENGIIKLSFASSNLIDGFGKLCSINVTAKEGAAGKKTISFSKLKFFDENGAEIKHITPQNPVITITKKPSDIPKLYFTNGSIDKENGKMTIYASLDGASSVCGGSALISYDSSSCVLEDIKAVSPGVYFNPDNVKNAGGKIKLSWASASPIADDNKLLSMTFSMSKDSLSALTYSNILLKDSSGNSIDTFNSFNGKIYDSTNELQLEISSSNITLNRDYAQIVPVKVKNVSDNSLYYYLKAENSYSDIYLNFVSAGSDLEPILILPGETQTINMSVFLQNAVNENYSIPVKAFVEYGSDFYINTKSDVSFGCHIPVFDIQFTKGSVNDSTLASEWKIKNIGDAITDLTLSVEGEAQNYVRFESTFENYNFSSGSQITATLIPDLFKMKTDNVSKFSGKLVAQGGGKSFSTDITFDTQGRELICIDAFRMALWQDNNPYYQLQEVSSKSNFENLTEENLENFVSNDGSFEVKTEKTYSYSEKNAIVDMTLKCTPTTESQNSESPIQYSEDKDGSYVQTLTTVITEEDYLKLLSSVFSDMGDVFNLKKQAAEMAKEYLGVGNMEMELVMKITDPLINSLLDNSEELGNKVKYFTKAAQTLSKSLNNISDLLDVSSVWANPNINESEKAAYTALSIAEFASSFVSDSSGGWFKSGISTGFGLVKTLFNTSIGQGPLSELSNEELGYYVNTLVHGYQCTNAGGITSKLTLKDGFAGNLAMFETYLRLGTGELDATNILTSFSSMNDTLKANLVSNSDNSSNKVSLVWITGRMAKKDNSYIDIQERNCAIYVNNRYIGNVQNNGFSEMFSVGLITDAFTSGNNTIVRKFLTNPGSYSITTDTEFSVFVPDVSQIAYLGTLSDFSELRPLPDFAVYPENISVNDTYGNSITAIVGDNNSVTAKVYNRGQRGGWVDVVFTSGGNEIYRTENLYVGAFSTKTVTFQWSPDASDNKITVSLTNKTQGVSERRDTNNTAELSVSLRQRTVPVVENVKPGEIVVESIDDVAYLTADIRNYSDVENVTFSIDNGASLDISKAYYGNYMKCMSQINTKDIAKGQHNLCITVKYRKGTTTDNLVYNTAFTVRNHDCTQDGHVLLHHSAVESTFNTLGSIEYWYCDCCGKIFADAEASTDISLSDTVKEMKKLEVSNIVMTDAVVTGTINISNNTTQTCKIIIASYEESDKMIEARLLSQQELETAQTSSGASFSLKRGKYIKVFLYDDDFVPIIEAKRLQLSI